MPDSEEHSDVSAPLWLPSDWQHPKHVPLANGHHLRPIRPDDTELDMLAVMGSQERLWSIFGEVWGWPPATMTAEQDREDLTRHAHEMQANESFNYGLFDADETELLGCVYIDPAEKTGAGADISWWVSDEHVGTPIESELDQFVPAWIDGAWPLHAPRYIGRDLTWGEWLELPPATNTPGDDAD